MNAKEIKQKAQDMIMHHAMSVFYEMDDTVCKPQSGWTSDEIAALDKALKDQINRMERLFGYDVGSWKA